MFEDFVIEIVCASNALFVPRITFLRQVGHCVYVRLLKSLLHDFVC